MYLHTHLLQLQITKLTSDGYFQTNFGEHVQVVSSLYMRDRGHSADQRQAQSNARGYVIHVRLRIMS